MRYGAKRITVKMMQNMALDDSCWIGTGGPCPVDFGVGGALWVPYKLIWSGCFGALNEGSISSGISLYIVSLMSKMAMQILTA
jgi:hypothetical protein